MTLIEEVQSRPDCATAYAAKDCHELARLLSIGKTQAVMAPLSDVQAKLQGTGSWWSIKALLGNPAGPAYSAAMAVTDVASARYSNLDTSLPIVVNMLAALVAVGAMPQADMDAIIAMGVVPKVYTQREVAIELYHDTGEFK